MKLFDRVKKSRNDKGFTLVELIVVLVILAILAAILVPALLGYIDRARESQIVLNAKSALTAAQAEMSQLYGEGKPASDITGRAGTILSTADITDVFEKLTIGTVDTSNTKAEKTNHAAFVINYVYYKQDGKEIWFDGSAWVNADPKSSYKDKSGAAVTIKTYDIVKPATP